MDNNIYLIIGVAFVVLLALILFSRKGTHKNQHTLEIDKKSIHVGVNTEDLFRSSSSNNDSHNAIKNQKNEIEKGKSNPAMNWIGVDNYNEDMKEHTLKNKSDPYSYNAQDILQKAKDRLEVIKEQKFKLAQSLQNSIVKDTNIKENSSNGTNSTDLASTLKTNLENQSGSLLVPSKIDLNDTKILQSTQKNIVNSKSQIDVGVDGSLSNLKSKNNALLNPLILIVDDAFVVRKKVGDLLHKNNYDISSKNDGWEAFAYLSDESNILPNLIITDIEMPNMDGFQLIENIRKNNRLRHLPIIVISSHVEDHLAELNNDAVQGFISKPFVDEDLLSQISYILTN